MLKSKFKNIVILLLAFILISSVSFATVEPQTTEADVPTTTSEEITEEDTEALVSEDDWVKKDLFICEDTVVVDQVVDGNAFIIGQDVTISGEIGGDLFVIADKLTIEDGYVYSSIFACANDITINGVVYDVYALSNNFTLSEDGFIYRDLKISSSTVNINGAIKRNAYISAQNYNFADTALIGENLEYSASEDITIPEDVVTGEVIRNEVETTKETVSVADTILSYVSDLVKTLVYTLVVVLLLLWLAPKFVNRVGQMSVGKDFAALGIGLAAILATIIGGILLLITVIGIPLAISAILVLSIIGSISFSITSIFFGNIFAKSLKLESKVKFVLITLASSIILWIICQIPFIGGLASLLITLFGIGATILNIVSKKDAKVKEEVKE